VLGFFPFTAFAAADSINGTGRVQRNAGGQVSQQTCTLERQGGEMKGPVSAIGYVIDGVLTAAQVR